jgi:hypothetical protein
MKAAGEMFRVMRMPERRDVRLLTFACDPTECLGRERRPPGSWARLLRPYHLEGPPCRSPGQVWRSTRCCPRRWRTWNQGIGTQKSGCGTRVAHRCRSPMTAAGSIHVRSSPSPPPRAARAPRRVRLVSALCAVDGAHCSVPGSAVRRVAQHEPGRDVAAPSSARSRRVGSSLGRSGRDHRELDVDSDDGDRSRCERLGHADPVEHAVTLVGVGRGLASRVLVAAALLQLAGPLRTSACLAGGAAWRSASTRARRFRSQRVGAGQPKSGTPAHREGLARCAARQC